MSCGELCQPAPSRIAGQWHDADAFADFGQMLVHGVDTDNRHDQGGAVPRAGQMAPNRWPSEPPVAPDARARAALAQMRVSVPCWPTRLHPEPDFDRPAGKLLRDCGARQLSEVF